MWTFFNFRNGSNPYITKTNEFLFKMICKYYLTQIDCKRFYVESEREICPRHALKREDKKAILQNFAIEWQRCFEFFNYSWDEIAEWQNFFEEYGRKFGLLKEFRENGIL